jgi:tetratricopeptide (TPR) repeat protein
MSCLRLFVIQTIFYILILISGASAEAVSVEPYHSPSLLNQDFKILKLQTKVRDLELELSELKGRFEQIEHLQKKILSNIGEDPHGGNDLLTQKAKDSEYQYAYNQLINNDLDKAERAFDLYLEKYPSDNRLGEVYFWKGEISYKRKDYQEALEHYLTSYQKYPSNERHLDSLFKMSIVLGMLGKKKEACEGFALLTNDQVDIDENLQQKSLSEAVQLGCIN